MTAQLCNMRRNGEWQNKIKDSETRPHRYGQLILEIKCVKYTFQGGKTTSSINSVSKAIAEKNYIYSPNSTKNN